ncbi:G2/mitotic-specific cyclin-B2-like [Dermacentor silvarum]|uniref:G2/mitotic-specific cyclin-B2-like n=1 Tax=Dermacentor silvarum TaxID=543639 RepID=UPI0021008393|nr:G2/mitotic-specific cyclin-B2-like [Dermacentor silvarum]
MLMFVRRSEQNPDAEEQGFSASLLPPGVPDIDVADLEQPQMCAQYAQEIDYMAQLEVRVLHHDAAYISAYQVACAAKVPSAAAGGDTRNEAILINWMMMVHQRFQLLQETLFLAVSLTDRFLQAARVNLV